MSRLPYSIRALGSAIIGRVPLPVLAGPNQGRLWSLASAGRGYVTGRFEERRMQTMLALVRAGDRVWDIGAHKGYVALALARAVGREGHVLAFEPSYRNLELLHRHQAWNRPRNLEVMPVALSDAPGEAAFGGTGSSITYRLGHGDEMVTVRTFAGLVEGGGRPVPDVVKIDVEGSEADVLRGAGEHLADVDVAFVAVHSREAYEATRPILDEAGFNVLLTPKLRGAVEDGPDAPWPGDPELVAWRDRRGITRADVEALPGFAG